MSSDPSWEPEYCLGCDKQTDGQLYCSETCRLMEYSNSSHSAPSSPGLADPASYNWAVPRSQSRFYLEPAYDFRNAQPYGPSPVAQPSIHRPELSSSPAHLLTPSSSHSSLCSLESTTSTGSEKSQMSSKTRKQLRDYASSFETARIQQRRRSC
ncbi:hypothetical protein F5Y16DRAFT_368850 [Xylariaceae sp. FL0255]|nr:hypothetical protein F5Y16DRAFT_368850 [Xylariaceae sp. FL0255]